MLMLWLNKGLDDQISHMKDMFSTICLFDHLTSFVVHLRGIERCRFAELPRAPRNYVL